MVHAGRFHQHDAAAAGAVEVFVERRVGDLLGIETLALVGDADGEGLGREGVGDVHQQIRVEAVAVADGVGQGFVEGQVNGELGVFGKALRFHFLHDAMLRVSRGGERGGEGEVDGGG